MPFPNPETQFKPGQSGNPAGRPPRRPVVEDLEDLIAEKKADRAIAAKWLEMMLKGDFRYLQEYLNRRDGKVKDPPANESTEQSPATNASGDPIEP